MKNQIKSRRDSASCPLAVPKIYYRLGAPINFDRYANKLLLNRPQDALKFVARHQPKVLLQIVTYDKNYKVVFKKMAERKGFEPLALSSHWFSRPAP